MCCPGEELQSRELAPRRAVCILPIHLSRTESYTINHDTLYLAHFRSIMFDAGITSGARVTQQSYKANGHCGWLQGLFSRYTAVAKKVGLMSRNYLTSSHLHGRASAPVTAPASRNPRGTSRPDGWLLDSPGEGTGGSGPRRQGIPFQA